MGLLAAGIVYSCTDKEKHSSAAAAAVQPAYILPQKPVPSDTPSQTPAPLPAPKPVHYYDSAEGSTYYYGAVLSEEERKAGKRAPTMVAFWYLGRDDQGRDRIQQVQNGTGFSISTCLRPCKVIHHGDGTVVGFDSGSIIGAAFYDAQHGFLKKHAVPKRELESEVPWPGDPVSPAQESPEQ